MPQGLGGATKDKQLEIGIKSLGYFDMVMIALIV